MLRPFIVLENHSNRGAREFIAKHIQELKKLGYKKLMLEMDKTVSPEEFKRSLFSHLLNPQLPPYIKACSSALLNLMNTAQQYGLEIEFVDPESLAEAQQFSQRYKDAKSEYERQIIRQELDKATLQRDDIMTDKILEASGKYSGGVIFLGGFAHVGLVNMLGKKLDLYELNAEPFYLILSQPESNATPSLGKDESDWKQFENDDFRKKYYNRYIPLINNPLSVSFDIIKKMMSVREANESYLGSLFNAALDTPFNYYIDQDHILSATYSTEDGSKIFELMSQLNNEFTGLFFQSSRNGSSYKMTVMDLNSEESTKIVSEAFVKKGLMRK